MKRILALAISVILIFTSACSATNTTPTTWLEPLVTQAPTPVTEADTTVTEVPQVAANKSITQTLTSGYYTVGIDFPAGKYNFLGTVGGGNVSTDDYAVNLVMGSAAKGKESTMYIPTYSNADLSDGTVLSVLGLTIQITSSNASTSPLKTRNQTITKILQFTSGNYVAGQDFTEGTYNLTAVSGAGNVSTDDFTLNAVMGTGKDDMYQKTYQNVEFKSGVKLTISGVTISLTPSK